MKSTLRILPVLLIAAALLLSACNLGGGTPPPAGEQPPAGDQTTAPGTAGGAPQAGELEGVNWKLTALAGPDGTLTPANPEAEVTAAFADGRVNGRGGCNNYFGPYERSGDQLTIGEVASTMMACFPDSVMQQETLYLQRLGEAASYRISGGQLELLNAAGEVILQFEVLAAQPLTGVTWVLTDYNNGSEAVVSVINGTEITAEFGADGTLSGTSGCNRYTTAYEVDGQNLSIGPAASTLMACSEPEGLMDQEAAFLAALERAATYTIQGDRLEIRSSDGAIQLNFVAGAPSDQGAESAPALTGATWQLMNYNNGREAVVGMLPETQITAEFGADGSLSGSSGCNQYNTTYEVNGQNITIGPAASTMMACTEPEGIMEQEAAYLAALERAATFSIQGDQLEIRSSDDALQLVFVAAGAPAAGAEDSAPEQALFPIALTFDDQGLISQPQVEVIRPTPYDNSQAGQTNGAPLHIQVSSGDYVILRIFPVDQYALLWAQAGDNRISSQVDKLRGLLAERPAEVEDPLPILPPPATFDDLAAQAAFLDFDGGAGLRYVGRVAPNRGPVDNTQLRYFFQGLSSDGKYYLAFEYPITTPALPGGPQDVPPEVAQQANADFPAYIQATREQLNARNVDEFMPNLNTLDDLIRSISLTPTGAAGPDSASALTGVQWQWVQTQMSDGSVVTAPDPAAYTLEFTTDGTVSGQADCNVFNGVYQTSDPSLTIEIQMTSLAACPEDSLSDQYLSRLGETASFLIRDGHLFLALKFDSGIMEFRPAP